jgi:lincosamide nucleotidyltransferase A/C/D/E
MEVADAVEILDLLEIDERSVWVDGGWGVDALLERQTREHDDLDLVLELSSAGDVIELLEGAGYELVAGGPPKSFVLVDERGLQVDVHPVVFDDARGGGVYRTDDGGEWVYPAAGFGGRGRIGDRPVRCLTPDVQVLVHDGYELTGKDYRELFLLHERFGVALPARYAERAFRSGGRLGSPG